MTQTNGTPSRPVAAFAGRAAYAHWQPVQTRWLDNDVYGHVNNTIHYQWFDLAGDDPIGLVVEPAAATPLR